MRRFLFVPRCFRSSITLDILSRLYEYRVYLPIVVGHVYRVLNTCVWQELTVVMATLLRGVSNAPQTLQSHLLGYWRGGNTNI